MLDVSGNHEALTKKIDLLPKLSCADEIETEREATRKASTVFWACGAGIFVLAIVTFIVSATA